MMWLLIDNYLRFVECESTLNVTNMFPHLLTHHQALYPSFLRSSAAMTVPTSSSSSLAADYQSTNNTSFFVENLLRDRAAAAAAVVAASKDCNSINSPFITRPLPLHPTDHSPCGYPNCTMKQCSGGNHHDLIKRERVELLSSSDHETESSYGGDLQSESNTPPIKSQTNIPLKFGVSAILSDNKDHFFSGTAKHQNFLNHHKSKNEFFSFFISWIY